MKKTLLILTITIITCSCSTYRREMSSAMWKDETYLKQQYGEPDSVKQLSQGKVFVYIDSTMGVFGSPIGQRRYFYISDKTGMITNWHFDQWGKDYQDRRIINK